MEGNEIEVRVQQELSKILADPRQVILYAARALQEADNKITALEHHVNKELLPKVEQWEMTMGSDSLFEMSSVAKILNFRNMGRNNLFEYLKENKILRFNKEPYQSFVDRGFFKVIEQSFDTSYGVQINRKTMVTQKGVDFIGSMLKKDGYELNAR